MEDSDISCSVLLVHGRMFVHIKVVINGAQTGSGWVLIGIDGISDQARFPTLGPLDCWF
jgi:hypothetical protein